MADGWPWPADDALTRAQRVCMEYRSRLHEQAPDVCADVDRIVTALGQTWVTGVEITESHVMTTAEAAAFLGISVRGVRMAVTRGRLTAAGKDGDGYLFQKNDLLTYLTRRARCGVA